MDHEKWLEQHDQMMADHHLGMAELRASQAKTEQVLRRGIRLAVEDARRQRKPNAEFKENDARLQETDARLQETDARLKETDARLQVSMDQLAIALKAFLERGGNGQH